MAINAVFSLVSSLFAIMISLSYVVSETHGFGGAVFSVNSKLFGKERSLSVLIAHDSLRHLQILASGVDIPLGGSGRSEAVGLYYTKLGLGTPPREYNVQVDTGSDIMWINCIHCEGCPENGYNGIDLTQYDPKDSITGNLVTCGAEICAEINGGTITGCKANASCLYSEIYGDGSESIGYLVKDVIQYESVSGDLETKLAYGSVVFGCGTHQSDSLRSSGEALNGILGFGNSNVSIISQLASSGKVKKMFAHCLDGDNGGGIFAVGHVVLPKVNSTHLIQDQPHYSVNVTGIEVGTEFLNISAQGRVEKPMAIIDSGTTLAYLPDVIYNQLVNKIVAGQSDMQLYTLQDQYKCFEFSRSVAEFPTVKFYFESSLSLKVYPSDYLFALEDSWCLGWQSVGMGSQSSRDTIILGDMVLSNKLVLYDLENQTIGWTNYNCSSNITLRDEVTGSVHLVGFHHIDSACKHFSNKAIIFLLLIALLNLMIL